MKETKENRIKSLIESLENSTGKKVSLNESILNLNLKKGMIFAVDFDGPGLMKISNIKNDNEITLLSCDVRGKIIDNEPLIVDLKQLKSMIESGL